MKIFLLFPHQLYENIALLKGYDQIYLIEEFLYFNQYRFHKQKIRLHRASMKFYENYLIENGFNVQYIDAQQKQSDIQHFSELLESLAIQSIDYYDPTDDWLSKRIKKCISKLNVHSTEYDSPNFFNTREDIFNFFKNRNRILHHDFYVHQRKKWNLLMNEELQPEGGKWSFDEDNRKKYPNKKNPPKVNFPTENPFIKEANEYVKNYYSENIGQLDPFFIYPSSFEEAKNWLFDFIENRIFEFGTYEDAIVRDESILHHSLLSSLLNIGLLNPFFVVAEILKAIKEKNIPINSAEGILRQLIGWREFVRGIYLFMGAKMRRKNFWNHEEKITSNFYTGTTQIAPIDQTIKKLLQTGYNHHIERLMVLGNFFLLNKFHPDRVYQWFMEMYIDAYDWVMVPNIYGMSQFSDGGSMVTKPYISSSNYILKMSNYAAKEDWCEIWDALYWNFISENRLFFSKNPRLQFSVNIYDKFSSEKKEMISQTVHSYFQRRD